MKKKKKTQNNSGEDFEHLLLKFSFEDVPFFTAPVSRAVWHRTLWNSCMMWWSCWRWFIFHFCSVVLGRCGAGRLVTKLQRYVINQLWDAHIKVGSLIRDLGKLDYKNGSQSIIPEVPWGEEEVLAQLFHASASCVGRTGDSRSVYMLLKSEVRWGVGCLGFFWLCLKQVSYIPVDQNKEQDCLHRMGFDAREFCKIYIADG